MSDEHIQHNSAPAVLPTAIAVKSEGEFATVAGEMHPAASNQADAADSNAGLIERRVAELQSEHLALDVLIEKLIALPGVNDFELRRLKKRKLKVKDSIILLQLQLDPDTRA
jgi:hypothetical protein